MKHCVVAVGVLVMGAQCKKNSSGKTAEQIKRDFLQHQEVQWDTKGRALWELLKERMTMTAKQIPASETTNSPRVGGDVYSAPAPTSASCHEPKRRVDGACLMCGGKKTVFMPEMNIFLPEGCAFCLPTPGGPAAIGNDGVSGEVKKCLYVKSFCWREERDQAVEFFEKHGFLPLKANSVVLDADYVNPSHISWERVRNAMLEESPSLRGSDVDLETLKDNLMPEGRCVDLAKELLGSLEPQHPNPLKRRDDVFGFAEEDEEDFKTVGFRIGASGEPRAAVEQVRWHLDNDDFEPRNFRFGVFADQFSWSTDVSEEVRVWGRRIDYFLPIGDPRSGTVFENDSPVESMNVGRLPVPDRYTSACEDGYLRFLRTIGDATTTFKMGAKMVRIEDGDVAVWARTRAWHHAPPGNVQLGSYRVCLARDFMFRKKIIYSQEEEEQFGREEESKLGENKKKNKRQYLLTFIRRMRGKV